MWFIAPVCRLFLLLGLKNYFAHIMWGVVSRTVVAIVRCLLSGCFVVASALDPSLREEWAEHMVSLLTPGGELVTLIFPIVEKARRRSKEREKKGRML